MKKLLILTTVLVLTAAACNKQVSVNNNKNQITQNTDETANWKTYSNSQYSFEIKYPDNYDAQESKDQGATAVMIYPKDSPKDTKNGVGIQIVVIPNTTVDDFSSKVIFNANAAYPDNHLQVLAGHFVDQSAFKSISYTTAKNGPTVITTLAQKGNNVFELAFLETNPNSTESKISHTFKFTK